MRESDEQRHGDDARRGRGSPPNGTRPSAVRSQPGKREEDEADGQAERDRAVEEPFARLRPRGRRAGGRQCRSPRGRRAERPGGSRTRRSRNHETVAQENRVSPPRRAFRRPPAGATIRRMPEDPAPAPKSPRRIAVVGGGLAGLVAADRLLAAGHSVVVFEKYPEAGGLVGTFSVGGEPLERFYHHLFTSDVDYVSLAGELGLGGEIEWLPSKMGFFSGGRLYPFGTPASLLGFSPLGVKGRLELVLSTLRLRAIRDWRALEGETAVGWLKKNGYGRVLDVVWGPLLTQKYGRRAGGGRASSGSGERSPCAPVRATRPASASGSATCAAPSAASSRRSSPASPRAEASCARRAP